MSKFYNRNWRMANSFNGSEDNNSKFSNYSMSFDGTEWIDTTTNLNSLGVTTSFSVSCWVNISNNVQYDNIISGPTSLNVWTSGFGFYLTGTEVIFWVDHYIGANQHITSAALNNNEWYHITGTFNTTNGLKLYVNAGTPLTASGTVIDGLTNNIYIGSSGNASTRAFNGKLDQVALFDYALTQAQITALYGSSSTGVGNPMAITNGRKPVAYYPLGDYSAYNGTEYLVPNSAVSDYVFEFNVPSGGIDRITLNQAITLTGNKTFSAWLNLTTAQDAGGFLLFGEASTNFYLFIQGDYIYIRDSSGFSAPQYTPGFSLNTWYHICISGDGTNLIPYVNGSPISGTYADREMQSENTIGSFSNRTFPYRGEISNIQIWDTNLSGPEVTTLYNYGSPLQGTQPQSANLQGWWKLDASATFDGSNWSIPDDSTNSNTGTSSGMTAANLVQSNLNILSPYSRYSLDFDGNNDFITTGYSYDAAVNNNLTLSFWYKSTTTGNFIFPLSIKTDGGLYNSSIVMVYNKKLLIQDRTGWVFGSTTINDGNWHNIVVTAAYSGNTTNGTNLNMYIDGNSTADLSSLTMDSGANSYLNGTLYFGNFNGASNFCVCTLSNVAVWESILTSTQITEIYNNGLPSNLNNHSAYSNLVSWWQLGENSSFNSNWTVLDEKGTNNGTSSGMSEDDLISGVGTSGNGISSGMSGADNIIGEAPYSTSNALSYGMGADAKSTDVPS